MPFFRSTYNILTKPDEDEVWHWTHTDRDTAYLPPKTDWDYQRELTIEDVNIWEVLIESSGGIGIYAAWDPHAEFYLVTTGFDFSQEVRIVDGRPYDHRIIETYYGQGAAEKVIKRAKELKLPIKENQYWVENDQLWLYQEKERKDEKIIILPFS